MDDEALRAKLHNNIETLVKAAIKKHVFPGAAVGICEKGSCYTAVFGNRSLVSQIKELEKETYFDLASLTKPFATTLAILCLLQDGLIHLDQTLPSLLEKDLSPDKKKITLRQLLNHCSGFADHRPYYKKLIHIEKRKRKNVLLQDILQEELKYPAGSSSLYSDLGFILLGHIVEKKGEEPFDIFVREKVMQPIGLADSIIFNPLQQGKENFAATEQCPWRKKVLSGEVHDDNTFAVGGVSGQAGLFADVGSVLNLAVFLLEVWKGRKKHPNFSGSLLKEFFKKQDIVEESSWALGFDTPSPQGSSAGKYISSDSIGHLGFTGTSFWIDPQRELVMVLLSNRVHPSRENNLIREFRPLFHDAVMESIS